MDIAVVSAGVNLTLDAQGRRQAMPALRWAPSRRPSCWCRPPPRPLIGTKLDDAALEKLAAACSAACKPIDDKRGTIEFRTKVAGVLARRAAKIAYQARRRKIMSGIHVSTTINGDAVEFVCDRRRDAARRAAQPSGPDRRQGRLRHRRLRRLQRHHRRPPRLLLPRARRRSRRRARSRPSKAWPTATSCIPLQRKFIEHAALQCGICTPGFLIAAKALLDNNPDPTEEEIRFGLGRQSLPLHRLRQDRPRRSGQRPKK